MEGLGGGIVAGEGHNARDVTVDGVAKPGVYDVAGDEPGGHEEAEENVAGCFVVEVFEHFG